jgi:hypothetical protein
LSSESIRDPFHVIEGGDFKTPNKQLASIRTFQERRNNKLISGYFFPASCAAKKSKNFQIRSSSSAKELATGAILLGTSSGVKSQLYSL